MPASCLLPSVLALVITSPAVYADPQEGLDAGWEALRTGDLRAAQAGFGLAARSRKTREEAVAGALSVALARADEVAMVALLEGLDPARSSELLVLAAGAAEISLLEPSGRASAWVQAACELDDPQWPDEVLELCSWAPLLASAERLSHMESDQGLVLPFSYAGAQPVVLARVNGGEPVALLVDTGASSCLLTEQAAAALGLARREDTALQVAATGGLIPSWRELVRLELGGQVVQDVDVIVADLPITGLAGILSPQSVWPDRVVELDFSMHELRVAAVGERDLQGVALPYRQHGGRPYLELSTPDRPQRPVVIDTGAAKTHLDQEWEQLGEPLERGEAIKTEGAGGARADVVPTTGVFDASAGELALPLPGPNLYTPHHGDAPGVWNFGLLGAEAWMGRVISLDRAGGRLALTDPPALPPWQPGDQASFELTVDGSVVGGFTEQVVARDVDSVTLEVTTQRGEQGSSFLLRTPDAWSSRGAWMFTRPVLEAWTVDEAGERAPLEDGGRAAWMALFTPFRTVPSEEPPGLAFGHHTVAGQELSCTHLDLPAAVGETPADFSMLECPASPWRVAELRVQAVDGTVLWGIRRR